MNYYKLFLILNLTALSAFNLVGQTYESAIAFSMSEITIDGNLDDWPKDMYEYPIGELAFGNITEEQDLKGSFKIGYNASDRSIFIGVEVVDTDIINDSASNIDMEDNMYLYLDPIHSPNGGSRILFQTNGRLRDLSSPHPKAWSPYTPNLTWEDVTLKVKQVGLKTTYEWKIDLGIHFKTNSVIGMDIILSDPDSNDEQDTWMLWKRGTGKSEGSQRLGEVMLIEDENTLGLLKGNVLIKDSLIKQVNSVIVNSLDNPDIWHKVVVDSLNRYECQLPEGKYEVCPDLQFTSPRNSGDFNQNSRKIITNSLVYAQVESSKNTMADTLELISKPVVTGFFEKEGVLFHKDFDAYKVDRIVNYFKDYLEIPGVSIAIIKDKKLVYNKVFGVTNTLTNQALQKNSLFEGASMTKTVFALMVLKLAERGDLDLDKPLYQYLRFPNIEHDERYKMITARHVLNHQTGLDNWPVGSYVGSLSDAKADLGFDPGSSFKYSGEAMNYLGRVVEQITDKSLSQLFKEEIVPVFGLKNTSFNYNDTLENQIAMGHWHTYPTYKSKNSGVDSPASSISTEANDFSNFLLGLLNKLYLSKESYQLIYEPQYDFKDKEKMYDHDYKQGMGHSFFITELPEGKLIGHGGNNGDFDCKYLIMPEKGLGFVIFTNSNLGDEFIRLMEVYLLHGKNTYEREFKNDK